jgi:protein-disulfide isomerase
MNNKTLTQIMIGAVAFIAGFVAGSLWTENQLLKSGTAGTAQLAGNPTAAGNNAPAATTVDEMPEITAEDHLRGNSDAQVILVEYSDFECPFCNKFHPTMTKVMEEYGDKVAWVYRHYPLSFHPQAHISAQAAECVAKYGDNDKFWTFADSLYAAAAIDGGEALTEDKLVAAASKVGVNIQSCLTSEETADAVDADQVGGAAAGISGTPGTIVVTKDGPQEIISGALPYAQVKSIIDKYIK